MSKRSAAPPKRLRIPGVALLAAVTAVAACGCTSSVSVSASALATGAPGGTPASGNSPGHPHSVSSSVASPAASACGTTVVMPDSPPGAGPRQVCVRLGSTLTIRNGPSQPSGLEVWRLAENSAPAVLACTGNPRQGNPVGAVCRAVKPGVAILGVSLDYVSGGVAQPRNTPVLHVTVTVAA